MSVTKKPEVVVVTGASAGNGRAIARAFAKRGAHIGLVTRGHDGLEGARRDVEALGVRPSSSQRMWPTPTRSRRPSGPSISGSMRP